MTEASAARSQPWEIWVDTGGTFTDCVALAPVDAGEPRVLRRAKVLSTSALRGRIVRSIDDFSFEVQENWGACDDLAVGFSFHLIDGESAGSQSDPIRVLRFDSQRSILQLDRLPLSDGAGKLFELRADMPAAILAAHLVTQTPANKPLPLMRMRFATTRGTNALLERRGAPMALFITEGFRDLLVIGNQQRPELFALKIERPEPLYSHVVEIHHRIAADGTEMIPLDEAKLRNEAMRLRELGIDVAAVAMMHSHAFGHHEQRVAEILCDAGIAHVSCSSELAPLIGFLPRASTAVVDAYLSPIVRDHLQSIQRANLESLHVMTSAGGLARAESFRACDSLLSGPAGGIVGAAHAGKKSGFSKVIGFDMGGTSTDAARVDGDFEYRFEQHVGGVRLLSPALAIETVAAGGGSICGIQDERLVVGPQSAGASPGPACYGSGGPLTITDVNLVLGRLMGAQFEIPIQREAAERALANVVDQVQQKDRGDSIELLAQGFLDIANERMAAAIEAISIRKGFDPGEYALVAFGGAGGQHGCAVAARLGIQHVVMPADASLLSALGLGHAAIERFVHRQVLALLDECEQTIPKWIEELSAEAIGAVEREGISREQIEIRRIIVQLRLQGQDASLAIELKNAQQSALIDDKFREQFRRAYGHDLPGRDEPGYKPIEVESIRLAAGSLDLKIEKEFRDENRMNDRPASQHTQRAWFDGAWCEAPCFDRQACASRSVMGPALIYDRRTTLVIERGWRAEIDAAGAVIARRIEGAMVENHIAATPRAAQLELYSNRFTSIADDMGQMLQRTALSTNVKERLDFSCGLLNAAGELVVNAAHIPVHLGALGMCVRSVVNALPMRPGDVAMSNHPAFGGSHLPDITVITPVFLDEDGDSLVGYVASRAHHAEIGGTRPGSMPPNARSLLEEGVVIPPQLLIAGGRSRLHVIEQLLRSGPYPSRAVTDNVADLRAMIAANQRGTLALRKLAHVNGFDVVREHMAALADRAERLTRAALMRLPDRVYRAGEKLDDGSPIQVAISKKGDGAVIDFQGSLRAIHPGNLNATPAIVQSAVMYVLRLLIGEDVPLNEGMMRTVSIRIPQGMLNPPFVSDPAKCPAVVGGNTETSQRIVDTLLKALELAACSQGTMNNVLFGNAQFGYYETVCGGTGAGPGFDGCSAVHSHMTNTRITDPEIIEHRYPVRLDEFSIRHDSGGKGHFNGGNGAARKFTFLAPMSLSILSQHRTVAPFGLQGGEDGAIGQQTVLRANGDRVELKSIDAVEVDAGDQLILLTPGGGGFGA
jgi:5-oxoprolinase (ATP-hydrolysing)